MHDQADELRQLVLRSAASALLPEAPAPPLVVVAGGKGGVGATTIAVNLTVAFARQGRRAVLVDADFNQPDATALCQVKDGVTVSDVIAGRRTVHEALVRGPAGIQVLPGAWAQPALVDCSPAAQQRMLIELGRLGAHVDVMVLDAGNQLCPVSTRFWQAADLVVLVTSTEPAAIMDTYAAIKVTTQKDPAVRIRALVNRAESLTAAADAYGRIEQACQRFLGVRIAGGPHLVEHPDVTIAAQTQRAFVLQSPQSEPARSIDALADEVLAAVAAGPGSRLPRRERPGAAAA